MDAPGIRVVFAPDEDGRPYGIPVVEKPALSPLDPSFPTLRGINCYLERFSETHIDGLWDAYAPDKDSLWTYLPAGPFLTKESFAAAQASIPSSYCMYTIFNVESGRPVGNAAYQNINTAYKSVEVGSLLFSREMKRSKISTEAMHLMMTAAFENGFRRYEWKCNALNAPSISAAQRYGFSFEGLFRNFMVIRGCNRDTAWFSIIEEDWPAINAAFLRWLDSSNFTSDGLQVESLSQLTAPYVLSRFPNLQPLNNKSVNNMEFISNYETCVSYVEEYVERYMAQYNDPSHDWSHVQRVRKLALQIAKEEDSPDNKIDLRIVELASLLHDVGDKKFLAEGDSMELSICSILDAAGVPNSANQAIIWIVRRVSFRSEVEGTFVGREPDMYDAVPFPNELRCVQDADRLDAIGAIGIARCFSFNGSRNLKIYEQGVAPIIIENVYPKGSNARNHFYEKLLKIAGMLKTSAGRRIGLQRQAVLKTFVSSLDEECGLDPVSLDIYL